MPIIILSIFCLVETSVFLLQNLGVLHRDEFCMSGHFDSITGLTICLSLCVPVFLHSYGRSNLWRRIYIGVSLLACIVVVIHSKSRIASIFIAICMLSAFFNGTRAKKVTALLALVLFFLSVFLIKTDSTYGRFFILSQTLVLLSERPLLGWGAGGFEAHYMNVQADYFAAHPNSNMALLADNVRHPLNEFLYVAVNHGIISLLLLCFCFCIICCYYKKNRTNSGRLGMGLLMGIIVFSMFSYPFHYTFVWIMLVYALYLIFRAIIIEKQVIRWVTGTCVVFFVFFGCWKTKLFILEKEWLEVENDCQYMPFRTILSQYHQLYAKMKSNSRFLYNYAFVLREAGHYDEALIIAEECNSLLADYHLSLLLGDIHYDMKHDDEAISYYTLAHNMCPNRFAPLCAIYDVYKSQRNQEECSHLIKEILAKPIKVPSYETMEYVNYIRSESRNMRYDL